jgi:uncharacterized protein (DUF1330 family)
MAAYVIAEIDVHDADAYEPYRERAPEVIAAHGGRYVARGGEVRAFEGARPAGRVVILEFPDLDAAQAWYESEEYVAIRGIRQRASDGRVFVVDGLPST